VTPTGSSMGIWGADAGAPLRSASAPDSSSATPIVVSCPMSALMSATRYEKCPCYGLSPLSTADIGAGLDDVRGWLPPLRKMDVAGTPEIATKFHARS
jgi:hypothetical protein